MPPVFWILLWGAVIATIAFFYVRSMRRGRRGVEHERAWRESDIDGPTSLRDQHKRHLDGGQNFGGF